MSAALLEVSSITLSFGGLTSLENVSFDVQRGEILAVIGPNGAGKTSLFNCLTGVYVPQQGKVTLQCDGSGKSVLGEKPHKVNKLGIARTFQNIRLFPALTALENVVIGVESRQSGGPIGAMLRTPRTRKEQQSAHDRAWELLRFVDLEGVGNELAAGLSYGAQRRLEIARALATEPKLLLLDEPAAGTNPSEKLELQTLVRHIRDRFCTVVLIEHDMRLVMSVADRVVVLNFGKVIAAGTPAEVQSNPAVIEAYLGTPAEEAGA
jgi:branched-chain amino acid transport system ATP-binding protein